MTLRWLTKHKNVTENNTTIFGQAGEWKGDPDQLLKGEAARENEPVAKPVKKRQN